MTRDPMISPTRNRLTNSMTGPTRDGLTRHRLSRHVRAIGLAVVAVLSLTGCGAAHAVLGIHEAPKAQADTAPLTADHAERILARAFTAAHQGETATGAAARAAQRTAYTGQGLRAVRARARLSGIQPKAAASALRAPQPRLLAVSRGFGFPRFIVAQTVAARGGLPSLHLLTSPQAATPYRISMSAEMLPLAEVNSFGALSQGSPLVPAGARLAVAPATLLKLYAAQMSFPTKDAANPPFGADYFSAQVRARAAGVAKDVATQATFSQVHKVVPSSSYAVRQASGDALVFGVIQRTDSFKVKSGEAVNTVANKEFVRLTGKKRVTSAASISTLEFVIFAVPRTKGPARLVAAGEQVVAGSGS